MKVSELIGADLDYWVAKALGGNTKMQFRITKMQFRICYIEKVCGGWTEFCPSTKWSQGGPIIDGMKPTGFYYWKPTDEWTCAYGNGPRWETGNTALIAAMRCFVASKFGKEVDDE